MATSDISAQDAPHLEVIGQPELDEAGSFTTLPVRRSKYRAAFDKAIDDILDLLDVCFPDGFARQRPGSQGFTTGHYDMLAYPATKPERVCVTLWWHQYMFLADDYADRMSREQAHRGLNRRLCDVLASHGTNNPTAPFEKVLVRIIEDTLAIDPSRGAIMVQGWYDWLDGCDRRPPGEINSVEEFIDFRTQNSGFPAVVAVLPFAMDLDFDFPRYRALVDDLVAKVGGSFALTNDYWSLAKELHANAKGGGRIASVVVLIMEQDKCTLDQAMEKVKQLSIKMDKEALDERDRILAQNPDLPEDVRRFVHAIVWAAAGTALWSADCERYHQYAKYYQG